MAKVPILNAPQKNLPKKSGGYGVFIACAITVFVIAAIWTGAFYGMFISGVDEYDESTDIQPHVSTLDTDTVTAGAAESLIIPETEPVTDAVNDETAAQSEYTPETSEEVPFETEPETTVAETEAINEPEDYNFANAVPECEQVDDSYFSDAVFIGDSRTVGFSMHSGIRSECYYAAVGLHIGNLFTEKFLQSKDANGDTIYMTVMEALEYYPKYSKVYICFGLNEMGWYGSTFIRIYTDAIKHIKEIRPDVAIYIENIIPITAYASKTNYPQNGNPRIWEYNEQLAQLAKDEQVYYLDLFSAFAGDDGALPDSGVGDGVHFSKDYYLRWADYLRTHAVQ